MSCAICRNPVEKDRSLTYRRERSKIDNYKLGENVEICESCAKKEITRLKIEKIYKPVMDAFSSIVNDTLFDFDSTTVDAITQAFTLQHRTLQSNMFQVVVNVIEKIANMDEDMFDARNNWIWYYAKKAKEAWK